MKLAVIGGSGSIGRALIEALRELGHEARSVSPSAGVDVRTGRGLLAVLEGAQVIVDVSTSRLPASDSALAFFEAATRNVLASGIAAGVRHYVALTASPSQEALVTSSPLAHTLVRARQFFEFVEDVEVATEAGRVRHVAPQLLQRIAADDLVRVLIPIVLGPARAATIELGVAHAIAVGHLLRTVMRGERDALAVTPVFER